MLHVAPFKMVHKEVQKHGNKVVGDSEGRRTNRDATKGIPIMVRFSVPGPGQKEVCCVLMMAGGD